MPKPKPKKLWDLYGKTAQCDSIHCNWIDTGDNPRAAAYAHTRDTGHQTTYERNVRIVYHIPTKD